MGSLSLDSVYLRMGSPTFTSLVSRWSRVMFIIEAINDKAFSICVNLQGRKLRNLYMRLLECCSAYTISLLNEVHIINGPIIARYSIYHCFYVERLAATITLIIRQHTPTIHRI